MKEEVSVEISPSDSKKNVKFIGHLSTNMNDFIEKAKVKGTVEFRNDFTTTSFSGEYPFRKGGNKSDESSKLNISTVLGSKEKGVAVGVDTEVSLSTLQPKNLNLTVAFNKPDVDFSIFSKTKYGGSSSIGANYFQKYKSAGTEDKDIQLGGELEFNLSDPNSKTFVLGSSFKPSSASTFKTRFDSKGILGFAYTEKWSGPLSVTFGADWNIISNEANAHAPFHYGVKLAFK